MARGLRVGVLTGGGDAPGLNAVIRAVTKSLILEHNAEVVGLEDGFLGLIEQRMHVLRYHDVSGILTRGGTILGTNNKANPFSYYKRGYADVSSEVIKYCRALNLDSLVVIGGDGSMSIAHGLEQKGLKMIGVPKTIDNDIVATDRTFGFDTATSIAADAMDRLHTTAQSHNRVMIVETMGRYAGWIALYAGVASGADVILIPEIEYDYDEVVRVCKEREYGGQRFTIIAIAEGARARGGELTVRETVAESTDQVRLGGVGYALQEELKKRIRSEVRTTVLGHMQRGGTPTSYDRNLATVFGSYAAKLVAEGVHGRMVALQDNQLTSVPFEEVANRTRTVPRGHPMLIAGRSVGTSFGVADLDASFGIEDAGESESIQEGQG